MRAVFASCLWWLEDWLAATRRRFKQGGGLCAAEIAARACVAAAAGRRSPGAPVPVAGPQAAGPCSGTWADWCRPQGRNLSCTRGSNIRPATVRHARRLRASIVAACLARTFRSSSFPIVASAAASAAAVFAVGPAAREPPPPAPQPMLRRPAQRAGASGVWSCRPTR